MSSNMRTAIVIVIMAAVTFLLRALPFIVFRKGKTPKYVEFLCEYLPYSIIGMLVVYCLKDVSFIHSPFGIPELIAIFITVVLHVYKRNTLLSILCGTACYMLINL